MSRIDELRFVVRVAHMYYEKGLNQPEIARQLGFSQATVSRLLAQAKTEGIIRISIAMPQGVYSLLEEELVQKYRLCDAIVVDTIREDDERLVNKDIGLAAAYYLESAVKPNEMIGIASWSSTLLALVDSMHPLQKKMGIQVVQLMGGVGNPSAEVHANRLTSQLADLLKGTSVYLPAPGIVGSEAAQKVLCNDSYVQQTLKLFDHIDTALVGIGVVEPSKLLADSGNVFSREELDMLKKKGAVGNIMLRHIDCDGQIVDTSLDKRVIAMSLEQLRNVKRSIGVAGGKRKYQGILAALKGRWVNMLITDQFTANRLLNEP
jgi:DNA-binding transcriptional regulator LsrR (DeoR family)